MTNEETLKLALEALRKSMQGNLVFDAAMEAFKALEEALKQEQGEPVAWLQIGVGPLHDGDVIARTTKPKKWNPEWWRFEPLYTTPQPKQEQGEPVAKMTVYLGSVTDAHLLQKVSDGTHNFYTTTQQRKPLTVEEIAKLDCYDHLKFARAIEAAHGIKE
jgi:hypothetical protein